MELGLFQPYSRKAPHHEDHLTWAFLTLVKLVPLVLSTFLDSVAAKQREHAGVEDVIPPLSRLAYHALTVRTQVSAIPQSTGRVLSIVMTDEHWEQSQPIRPSERRARFDGMLCFDPSWVLVIENKPRVNDVREEQLHLPLPPGSELMVAPEAICLVWREIIEALGGLVSRGLCQGLEAHLIEDFLAFTEASFPYLNPYSKLGLCKGNLYLLRRRCFVLLSSLGYGQAAHNRGYQDYVQLLPGAAERVYVYPTQSGDLAVEIYPADTVSQARTFLRMVDVDALTGLSASGWTVSPHLHFGYISTHLQWATSSLAVPVYVAFWKAHPSDFGKVLKPDLPGKLRRLLQEGLVTDADVMEVERHILATTRDYANVIPGLKVARKLDLVEAIALDNQGKLEATIQELVREALKTWGQDSL